MKEIDDKVVFISKNPLPQDLADLPWNWEFEGSLSKLLGIYMGTDIFAESMANHLQTTLDKRLALARKNPQTLSVKV